MGIGARLRRLAPKQGLIRSSALLFAGYVAARLLGLLFSVTAARVLLLRRSSLCALSEPTLWRSMTRPLRMPAGYAAQRLVIGGFTLWR
jgi:hypothetical protein